MLTIELKQGGRVFADGKFLLELRQVQDGNAGLVYRTADGRPDAVALKQGYKLEIGDITVYLVKVRTSKVKLRFEAPAHITIDRESVFRSKQQKEELKNG